MTLGMHDAVDRVRAAPGNPLDRCPRDAFLDHSLYEMPLCVVHLLEGLTHGWKESWKEVLARILNL